MICHAGFLYCRVAQLVERTLEVELKPHKILALIRKKGEVAGSSPATAAKGFYWNFQKSIILTLKFKIMKLFIKIMNEDVQKEHFSVWEIVVYSILVPLCFIGLMCLAGYLETLCD